MANQVDTVVNPMQRPAPQTHRDPASLDPHRLKLSCGDEAELPARHPGDGPITVRICLNKPPKLTPRHKLGDICSSTLHGSATGAVDSGFGKLRMLSTRHTWFQSADERKPTPSHR